MAQKRQKEVVYVGLMNRTHLDQQTLFFQYCPMAFLCSFTQCIHCTRSPAHGIRVWVRSLGVACDQGHLPWLLAASLAPRTTTTTHPGTQFAIRRSEPVGQGEGPRSWPFPSAHRPHPWCGLPSVCGATSGAGALA